MNLFLIEYKLSHVTSSVLGRNIFLSLLFPSTLSIYYYPNMRLIYIFFMVQQSIAGHGLLSIMAAVSHSDKPHSVGLLWTGDQPIVENST